MSDAAATDRAPGTSDRGIPAIPLTPETIDALLADFRGWLLEISQRTDDREQRTEERDQKSSSFDLFSLVGQFTALRHEVNMQTRAVRAAVEQNAEVVRKLEAADAVPPEDTTGEQLRPIIRALIDIADALTLSLGQMERLRESAEPHLAELTAPPAEPPGFLARLFGARDRPTGESAQQAAAKLRQMAAAAADGYAMSLRRVERIFPALELEPFTCTGEDFDPELMEAVEVVDAPERPSGTVTEDVRPGYLWRGTVLRFAQVKVAR